MGVRDAAEAIGFGGPLGGKPFPQPKLTKFVEHRSGQMVAFLSIELASGMVIHDLRLMIGKNGPWIAMPSQKQVDKDGRPRLDANQRPTYSQIVEFRDRATSDRFREMVLGLVRREHPDALEDEDAP
jgi:hypothetical protein